MDFTEILIYNKLDRVVFNHSSLAIKMKLSSRKTFAHPSRWDVHRKRGKDPPDLPNLEMLTYSINPTLPTMVSRERAIPRFHLNFEPQT